MPLFIKEIQNHNNLSHLFLLDFCSRLVDDARFLLVFIFDEME